MHCNAIVSEGMPHAPSTAVKIFIVKTLSLHGVIMYHTETALIQLPQKENQIPDLFDSSTTVKIQTFTRKEYWFKYFS